MTKLKAGESLSLHWKVPTSSVLAAALVLLCATASTLIAETHSSESRMESLAEALLEIANLPSLSIAILEPEVQSDGTTSLEVAYAAAIGYADIDGEVRANADTRYRAASVSKIITATALARMVEAGKIDWDTELSTLGIEFPQSEGITPRRLTGHLAGIAHYQAQDQIERGKPVQSAVEALAAFRGSPRAGQPGEQYKYSTHGFTLLSAMLEVAGGKPFPAIVDDLVTEPLGLTATGPAPPGQGEEGMATLYLHFPKGPIRNPNPENPSYKWAGGGFASTPTELVKLARPYLLAWKSSDPSEKAVGQPKEDAFLSRITVQKMWTPQERPNEDQGRGTGVGVAWRVGTESVGDRMIVHHAGSMPDARSVLVLFPQESRAIAVMTNAGWDSDIERTASFLMDAWRAGSDVPEEAPTPSPRALLNSLSAGSYSYSVALVDSGQPSIASRGEATTVGSALSDEVSRGVIEVVPPKPNGPLTVRGLEPPPSSKRFTRALDWSLGLAQIDGGQWVAMTPRGLATGVCDEVGTTPDSEVDGMAGVDCRFQVSRALDIVVTLRPVAESP